MNRNFGTIAQNKTEARESPVLMFPGISDYWQLQIDGTGDLTLPTMSIYKEFGTTDLSGTLLTGSMAISGRVIKTKTIQNLVGGSKYKVYVMFEDGGIPTVREFTIQCLKFGVSPSKYQFAMDKYKLDESPIMLYPGQSIDNLAVAIAGQGIIASEAMVIYKDLTDTSGAPASNLTGSLVVVGRTITLKTIQNLVGGSPYIFYLTFTDDGKSTLRYCEIICPKLGV